VAFRVFDGELETRFRAGVGHLTCEILPRGETGEGSKKRGVEAPVEEQIPEPEKEAEPPPAVVAVDICSNSHWVIIGRGRSAGVTHRRSWIDGVRHSANGFRILPEPTESFRFS